MGPREIQSANGNAPMRCTALLASAAQVFCAVAVAVDVPALPRYQGLTPDYESPPFAWTGIYAGFGFDFGYGFGASDWSGPGTGASLDPQGAIVGGMIGYNWQMGAWVVGAEADAAATWINASTSAGSGLCAGGLGCATHNTFLGTARARIGYAFDRIMPYVTGGGAVDGEARISLHRSRYRHLRHRHRRQLQSQPSTRRPQPSLLVEVLPVSARYFFAFSLARWACTCCGVSVTLRSSATILASIGSNPLGLSLPLPQASRT